MGGTPRFPNGTGNSPLVWNPTPDPQALAAGTVRAGTWVLVQLSYRNTNTKPVASSFAGNGFFFAHVLVTPHADDAQPQKEGGRIQPTMYGGSATKQRTTYHVDPGWTFQAPWDCQLQIVSGGVSDPSVLVDVIVKLGYTPENLTDGPYYMESMLQGGYVDVGSPRSQRVYAPPVVGHPELVPATYAGPKGIAIGLDGLAFPPGIAFPPGASAIQVSDSTAISPAPTALQVTSLGSLFTRIALQPGQIEQLGSITQGGGSTDGVPATWAPVLGVNISKAIIWSRLGC